MLAIYNFLISKLKMNSNMVAVLSSLIVLSAPILMGFQNYDDMSRKGHYATRDYAANFSTHANQMPLYLPTGIMTLILYGMFRKLRASGLMSGLLT